MRGLAALRGVAAVVLEPRGGAVAASLRSRGVLVMNVGRLAGSTGGARRHMGLMSRFANIFSGSWTAEDMRELERAANSRPGDVTSQALFTHALLR